MHAQSLLDAVAHVKRSNRPVWQAISHASALLAHCPAKRPRPEDASLLASRVQHCGTWQLWRDYLGHPIEAGGFQQRLVQANFCDKHMLCPACSVARTVRMQNRYLPRVEAAAALHPGVKPAMVTLTIRNGEDLGERFQHLEASWRVLRKRWADFKKGKSSTEWGKVLGGVRAVEITHGKGGWHVHLHIFVLLSSYIEHASLAREWQDITGDSFVVGLTACHGGFRAGLLEVLKYTLKPGHLTPAQLVEAHYRLAGSRLCESFGCLYGLQAGPEEEPALDGPTRDWFALWDWAAAAWQVQDLPPDVDVDGLAREHLPPAVLARLIAAAWESRSGVREDPSPSGGGGPPHLPRGPDG